LFYALLALLVLSLLLCSTELLMALGKEKAVAIGTLVTAGCILLLTPVFHNWLPIIGPAWGILIIYSIMAVYLGFVLFRINNK
jgi:O-antigen/teichoic acid export membrane protein